MTSPKSTQPAPMSDVDILMHLIAGIRLSDADANDLVRAVLQNTVAATTSQQSSPPAAATPPWTNPMPMPVPVPGRASSYTLAITTPPSGPCEVSKITSLDETFDYHVPLPGEEGPFYIVTCSTDVGVFSGWENTHPLINQVSGCAYRGVDSLEDGIERVESALFQRKCALLLCKKNVMPRHGPHGFGGF
ncbi:hypothetical protein EV421DRAFT_1743511 [Armillaria borealis]|uniref:Uncharacterized protein n=1 Tax=Armillaria borealis TaxID=47425 RepID=A0AA39IV25_9AGAR|nr:hypothetical protein EV421DRAFT_1743511 [Armillaria borealis]